MHPLLCGAAPVTLCSASHVDTFIRREDRIAVKPRTWSPSIDIGPTNDTRRGVLAEVREARAGERRWERRLPFWDSDSGWCHGVKASDNRRRISFACSRSAQIADGKQFLSRRLRYRVHGGDQRRVGPRRWSPRLVILGAQSTENALSEAVSARKLWPDSKIILLYEYLSPADFQKLLMSEINGCVPLFASPDTSDQHARHDRDQRCPRHGRGRRETSGDPSSAARGIKSVRDQASVGRRRT